MADGGMRCDVYAVRMGISVIVRPPVRYALVVGEQKLKNSRGD